MEFKLSYKIKSHLWICDYERLWRILTSLTVVAGYLMIQGSTVPLLWDNALTRLLFYSKPDGDKTLYNIAISYFAAYIFYIIQVYIPEKNKTRKALISTALDAYNFIRQINIFLFVWKQFAEIDETEGVIKSTRIRKIYFNEIGQNMVLVSDRKDLGETIGRARVDYEKIMNNPSFQKCDDKIMQLFSDIDIIKIINYLYQALLSAELMEKTHATIMETFSNDEIKLLESIVRVIGLIYGFKAFEGFEETKDQELIEERNRLDENTQKMILENIDYFQGLSDDYRKSIS